METNEPAYEWELSKENVQPLKAGRKLCNLSAALQPNSTDAAAKIKEEKQRFELELRTYVGDDPLSVWHSYILWMEQNYPKGNRTQLSQLLEQCMAQYKDEEKYKNDPRYLQLWIKFAQLCEEAQEIYSYMYNQGICSALAGFYQAWAAELEALGNTKRANAIYQQGLDHCAQPTEWLLHRQSDFHARVVAQMAGEDGGMDNADTGAQDVENRVSLGSLRAHGRKKRVGSVRSTHSKPAVLNVAANLVPKSNAQGPAFSIYNEQENSASGALPPQTKQWAKMPVRSEVNCENEIKPGKWTNAKIRHHSVTTTPSQPAFTIHQDAQQPGVTPHKINPDVSQVLSARKPPRQPHDPLSALTAVPGAVKQVPMYCKHLVYVGAEEFSLEEIRAAGLMKRQEMAEKKHAEEERLRMQEELRAQREELAAIELQKQQLRLQLQQQQEALVEVDVEMAPQPPAYTNASSSGHENSASDSMSTQRLLAFQLSPSSGSMTNRRTPDVSVSTGATPQHGVPQHGGLVAPSPTVNTKDAMRLVLGLFNQSIASATKWGAASNSNTSTSNPKSTRQADAAAGAPFTIFVDENPPPTKEQHVEDLENRAPPGYQNGPLRSLAGILQPATDIATEPIQYEEEMEDDILAQPLKDEDQDEPVKCMDGEPEFGDLTFAPSCSSTRNFTGMTKQLSASDILGGSVYGQPGSVTTAGTPSQSASGMTSQSTAMATTTFGPSNLSCITERSDEDTKVSGCTTKEPSQLQCVSIASTASSLKSTTSVNSRALPKAHQLSPVSEPTENSVSRESFPKRTPTSSINQTCHEIDVSNYIAENCAADLLSQSVMVKPDNDPFDQDLITDFLGRLDRPINTYPMYHAITGDLPSMKARCKVTLGNKSYDVIRRIGEGAFAKVYEIRRVREEDRNSSSQVIKVQSPACPWEFYITHELHSRLDQLKPSMSSAFMKVEAAYISDTGSCLISELLPHGTILDVVNVVRASGKPFPEPLSVMVAIHLLRVLEALRASDMIHGDVKPDNILFAGFPLIRKRSSEIPSDSCLQLIDFGRGIDMRMFPRNTTFSVGVETSGFQCVEMMTGRPWTYQVDMFGVVGTLAVVIFGSYMKVRLQDGRWKINFTFKRWFKMKAAMTEVFDELLNVPSCTQLPDMTRLRRRLETDFRRYHMDVYNDAVREFTARLSS